MVEHVLSMCECLVKVSALENKERRERKKQMDRGEDYGEER